MARRAREAKQQEEQKSGASFSVEVTQVVIDVVVTDKAGDHIRGLTKDDFELSEEGERQDIVDCSEEGLPLTPEAETERDVQAAKDPSTEEGFEGRWFVLFFDESNMTPTRLAKARDAAREFVRYEIFPKDRVAVLSYGHNVKVLQDFTGDVDKLARALYTEGSSGQPLQTNVTGESGTPVRGEASGTAAAQSRGGSSEGRDVTENNIIRFQDTPDIQGIEKYQANERLYRSLSLVGTTLGKIRGRKTVVLFSGGFDAVFADQGLFRTYRDMVNVLNSANVAIYPVDTGSAAKAPGSVTDTRSFNALINTSSTDSFRNLAAEQISSLKILASDTGGQALVGSSDLGEQLKKMAYSTSSYYMLSYTPRVGRGGTSFRDVKVKVKRDGARALARKGYYGKQQFQDMTKGEKKDALEGALLSWVDVHDLPIALRTEFYPMALDRCQLGLELSVPRGLLGVDATGAKADVLIFQVKEDGKGSQKYQEQVTLSAEESLKDFRYIRALDMKPGSYWIKAVVRDAVNGTVGTTGAHVTIPEFEKDRPMMSSLVLMSPEEGVNLVASKDGAADVLKNFNVAGARLFPSAENVFLAKGEIVCFFRVTNLKLDQSTQLPRLAVRYTIWRDKTPIYQQTVHYKADEKPDPTGGLPIYVRLPVEQLGAGTYRLEVSSYDVLATKGLKADVDFTVVAPAPPAPEKQGEALVPAATRG